MPLADEVTNRVRTQLLVELTNPNDRSATTVNTTQLGRAVTDVQAAFRTYASVTYSNDDARHVEEAIVGVLLYLQMYAGKTPRPARDVTEWKRNLHDVFRLVAGGNNRVMPESSSQLTPTEEAPNGITVRPFFDPDGAWRDLVPDSSERGSIEPRHG